MHFCRKSLLSLLLLIIWSVAAVRPQLLSASGIAEIGAAHDRMCAHAGTIRLKVSVKTRFVKGSMNAAAQRTQRGIQGDFPVDDLVLTSEYESIYDFKTNRVWSKGSEPAVTFEKDAVGNLKLYGYYEFLESAFNGVEMTQLTPKERVDPHDLSAGISIPVEFTKIPTPDGGESSMIEMFSYGLYLAQGALPSPDKPLTAKNRLPHFEPDKWQLSQVGKDIVLTSVPLSNGRYYTYTLRQELGFLPTQMTSKSKGQADLIIDLGYAIVAERQPQVKSWRAQRYSPEGQLLREAQSTVLSLEKNVVVTPDMFTLKPKRGMIVMHQTPTSVEFSIAGNNAVKAKTNTEINRILAAEQSTSTRWFVAIGSLIGIIGVVSVLTWLRRRN